MRVEILVPSQPRWNDAAAFIEATFSQGHGARIKMEPLTIAVVTGSDQQIIAAAGMRAAADGFFSQVYLERPVTDLLSSLGRGPVYPEDIIEVVSLASVRPLATLPLIEAVTDEGRNSGKTWGIFTATRRLAGMLDRAGTPVHRLAPARPECISDPGRWGRYYETDPWVCALYDRGAAPLSFLPVGRARPQPAVTPCI